MHFRRHRYGLSRSPNVPTNLVTIGQILKKWQQFFKVQNDGRHLQKYAKAILQKRFFARNRPSPDFYGSNHGGFLDRRPRNSEFEGTKPPKDTCINRNTTFEPLGVQFGPKLRRVG